MSKMRVRIGTRGSRLAMWQAKWVRARLDDAWEALRIDIVEIKTKGDQVQDKPLAAIGGTGLFTKAIEEALLEERIDLAVHSMKDLATEMDPRLVIGAITARHAVEDVLISKRGETLDALPKGARVATSSLRRRCQLANLRPDLEIVDIRGNLDTRLRKLDESDELDAIIVARAGVERLGFDDRISEILDAERVLSAVGQGALAVQIRKGDAVCTGLVRPLNDPATEVAVRAERAFLGALQGGCQVPIGALAHSSGESVELDGFVGSVDGTRLVRGATSGTAAAPEELGERLARDLADRGGEEILAEIRAASPSGGPNPGAGRPLEGKVIVVTRPETQAGPLAAALARDGAEVLRFPVTRVVPPEDPQPLIDAVVGIRGYDGVLLTSPNGARIFLDALEQHGFGLPAMRGRLIGAVGPSTAEVIKARGLKVDAMPSEHRAQDLADALIEGRMVRGRHVLLPLAAGAGPDLERRLEELGVTTTRVETYRTVTIEEPAGELGERLVRGEIDVVTFFAGSAVRGFAARVGPELLREARGRFLVASIGPATSRVAEELGLEVDIEAEAHDSTGLLEAVCEHYEWEKKRLGLVGEGEKES